MKERVHWNRQNDNENDNEKEGKNKNTVNEKYLTF